MNLPGSKPAVAMRQVKDAADVDEVSGRPILEYERRRFLHRL
jgi:hypothetical protein